MKLEPAHPVRVDAALAALTAVGVPAVIVLFGSGLNDSTPSFWMAPALGVFLGGLLFLRRRWPVAVLLLSVGTTAAWHIAGLTGAGLVAVGDGPGGLMLPPLPGVWPASAAIFTVAAGHTRHGLAWAIGVPAVPLFNAPFLRPESGSVTALELLWVILVIAVARAYRNLQGWRAETAVRMAELERQREVEAQRAAAQERLLMAQELHDVVAHTLTVVGVQLRVADEALDDSPDEARSALRVAQQVRGKAAADLGALVGVLRQREPLAPQGDLESIRELVERTQMETVLNVDGDPGVVPAPVALATYRIVQEALTNVVRHAGASHVKVMLRYTSDAVHIAVSDDGGGGPVRDSGHGLAGMRERATALGGTFHAGPGADGGFLVEATLPVRP